MKWEVPVDSFSGDLRLLTDVLAQWHIDLSKNPEGNLFLQSTKFEACQSHKEVWEVVKHLSETLQTLKELSEDIDLTLDLSSVIETAENGESSKHAYIQVKSAVSISVTCHAASVTISPSIDITEEEKKKWEAEQTEKRYQDKLKDTALRVIPALSNSNVVTVLRLLSLELSPNSMGNIFTLIQHDMNGKINQLASNREATRFERSINHPKIFTENARHIVSAQEPPPSPMYKNEAEDFIRRLVRNWLQIKHS